ncbi:MAG: hypothetical protein HYZ38_27605 [Mycobacterium sp.]|nr:hypothetical protein [Mycobacterium sp.]
MSTATVYRPERNAKGIIGNFDDYPLGEVTGVILGGVSARSLRGFPGLVETSGQAAFPKDAPITVQPGDRVVISGVAYAVVGPVEWAEPSALTGYDFGYYWLTLESTSR